MEHFYYNEINNKYYIINYENGIKKEVLPTGNDIRKYNIEISGMVDKNTRNLLSNGEKQFIINKPKALSYSNKNKLLYKPMPKKFKGYNQFPFDNKNFLNYLTDEKSIKSYLNKTTTNMTINTLNTFNMINKENIDKKENKINKYDNDIKNNYINNIRNNKNIFIDKNYLQLNEKNKINLILQQINNNAEANRNNKNIWIKKNNSKIVSNPEMLLEHSNNKDILKTIAYYDNFIKEEQLILQSKNNIKNIQNKLFKKASDNSQKLKCNFNSKIYTNGELYLKNHNLKKMINPKLFT